MATNTFQIVITQTGAQQAAQAISSVGEAAQKSANIMAFFRQALVLASTVRAASGLVEYADAATLINNRLKVATTSAQDFARAQEFVYAISLKTGTSVEANAQTYGRLISATRGLGYDSATLEKAMTALTLSVRVGGATSQEARNAMIQFSQGLASGALRGDELRSVSEQLPALAQAIGDHFGVAGGQLIAFAKANPNILNTKVIIEALTAALPKLTEQAAKMTPTLAQGFENLQTAFIKLLGNVNSTSGVFSAFGRVLTVVANSLGTVITAATALLAVYLQQHILNWVNSIRSFIGVAATLLGSLRSLTTAQFAFGAALSLNPINLWIAAIAAAGVAMVALYEHFPVVRAAVDSLFGSIGQIIQAFSQVYNAIVSALPEWASFSNVMEVVARTVAVVIKMIGSLITFAFVPVMTVIAAVVSALHAFGLASDGVAQQVGTATANLYKYAEGLLQGKTASVDAGGATEQLTEKTKQLLNPLLGSGNGAKSAAAAHRELADEVKGVEQSYLMAGERITQFASGPVITSVEGFNNLARVTKDWEKYTTDAGTAVGQTAAATTNAKAPTDALAGSMAGVNKQASGAASAANSMASSLDASAKSSTTTVEQVGALVKSFDTLNPLMVAAGTAAEQAAKGFTDAGNAAAGAVSGIEQLVQAYKDLAAAKAAAASSGGSNTGGTSGGARAAGGPVVSGSTYLVGEKGPELFTPNSNGNIIPNHVLTGSGAANDNLVPLIKAINRMASSVMTSNQLSVQTTKGLITEIQTQTNNTAKSLQQAAVDWTNSEYAKGLLTSEFTPPPYQGAVTKFSGVEVPPGYSPSQLYVDTPSGLAKSQDYAAYMRQNRILQGDSAYAANMVTSGYYDGHFGATYAYDANTPLGGDIAVAQMQAAVYQSDQAYKKLAALQEESALLIKKLQEARAAEDAFSAFKKSLPMLAEQKSSITDLQTLTPWEGGKQYGTSDPYGIGSAPRPDQQAVETNVGQQAASISNDNRVQVQMTVNTPNADSFRQNRASIEGAIASMVDRANRRAGKT